MEALLQELLAVRWEYQVAKCFEQDPTAWLNKMGADGWMLIPPFDAYYRHEEPDRTDQWACVYWEGEWEAKSRRFFWRGVFRRPLRAA